MPWSRLPAFLLTRRARRSITEFSAMPGLPCFVILATAVTGRYDGLVDPLSLSTMLRTEGRGQSELRDGKTSFLSHLVHFQSCVSR